MHARQRRLFLAFLLAAMSPLDGPHEHENRGPRVEVLWHFTAGGCLAHGPAVVGDMVYVASANGFVRELERDTGYVRWVTATRRKTGTCVFRGTLPVTPDLVLAAAGDGTSASGGQLQALERATGRQRWIRFANQGVRSSLVVYGRRIFAPIADGELWCLNLDSGVLEWSFPHLAAASGDPVLDSDRVFASGAGGWLYALNAADGLIEWRTKLGARITTPVRRSGTDLFAGTRDGLLHRIDMRDGRVLSSRMLDAHLTPRTASVGLHESLFVLLGDDSAGRQALVSLDDGLRDVRWRVTAPGQWSTTRPFLWKKTVILGTTSGEVTAYCTTDGSVAWTHRLAGTIRVVTGDEDALYIGTAEGDLEAVRPPRATCQSGA